MKKYKIPELKIEISAKDDEDFERKKAIYLNRNTRFNTGGHKSIKRPVIIKEF